MLSPIPDGYSRGVGVFIIKDNQLLLTHRTLGEQPGVWEVVAGRIKAGETAEDTAVREAGEETGLVIRVARILGQNVDDTHKFVADIVLAKILSGEARNLDERHHSAIAWFPIDQLPQPLGSTTQKGLAILREQRFLI